MGRRKVRDVTDASALLDELDASGMELGAFCQQRGVDGRSLNCWQINLGRKQRPPATSLRLVELSVPKPPATYRVLVGDAAVEVDDDFREETLARLLRVVAAC